jgi:hypothetical protein
VQQRGLQWNLTVRLAQDDHASSPDAPFRLVTAPARSFLNTPSRAMVRARLIHSVSVLLNDIS